MDFGSRISFKKYIYTDFVISNLEFGSLTWCNNCIIELI